MLPTTINILNKLKQHKKILTQNYSVITIGIFGSYATGNATEDSDIDIAILKDNKKSFFMLLKAKSFLEKHLNKHIDIGDFESMKTFIKNRIKKDFIYV